MNQRVQTLIRVGREVFESYQWLYAGETGINAKYLVM